MLVPPPIEPGTLAVFVAFSVSLTQLIKQEYLSIKNITLYLISSGSFIGASLAYVFLPLEWQSFYLMMIGGISIPGAVGLVKEIRREGQSDVTVTDAKNVTAEKGSSISVANPASASTTNKNNV